MNQCKGSFLIFVSICAAISGKIAEASDLNTSKPLHRRDFPLGFVFATSSSAYQYEGAAREGGRGLSIWDTFAHEHPEKIKDRSNGDVADDQYHRYKEDVKLMKEIGFDAYRFSISWTRILPSGSMNGGINNEGVNYYNNLIDELTSRGLQPFVTLFHWDSPQGIEDKYRGFLSHRIVKDFVDYAELCFRLFGDRVKHWTTFNEPLNYCSYSYATGVTAPGRCSRSVGNCTAGDSSREPYLACHHLLLAHAAAVRIYKAKYQEIQKGQIGIVLETYWFLPYTEKKPDIDAVQRVLDFEFGWFMEPLTEGVYPSIMRTLVGDRLPKFSKKQSRMLKGSFDFIGINYYTSFYIYDIPISSNATYTTDSHVGKTSVRNGIPIGPKASWRYTYECYLSALYHVSICIYIYKASCGLLLLQTDSGYMYPQGLRDLLVYTKNRYKDPTIYITENGVSQNSHSMEIVEKDLKDDIRIKYYKDHLLSMKKAIRDGVDVRGYFAWSLLDDFEWEHGYTIRFGIIYVDFKNNLKRYLKDSAIWFHKFLET